LKEPNMIYRVDVANRDGYPDARGEAIRRQATALGIHGIAAVQVSDIYFLRGHLDEPGVQALAGELLHDPVIERVAWRTLASSEQAPNPPGSDWTVEVALLPGVTDSVAGNLLEGARVIGETRLEAAATGQRYAIRGDIAEDDVHRIAAGLLANGVIQTYAINRPISPAFVSAQAASDVVETIALTQATADELVAISRERGLALDLAEMQAIQDHFRALGREPTDVELEMLAQTWSEHCVHKTFKALIDYREVTAAGEPIPGTARRIDSLLKTYIRAATEQVARPWVYSAFVDNAGIIAFDDTFDLAFKVETHNHPSALEPFGGANTGVGGVIRDVIGVSARPIANTDVLCFGPPDLAFAELPSGVLHPRRIADGVTAGIEDYGNKMGIPTVNGAILYDPGYTANPLVFCGCLGLLPHGSHRSQPQVGDLVVVIGGRTGRDGLHGATFSSMEMNHETGQAAGSAVQIGHPIHEKQALEAVLLARDAGLYTAITDCGAGGLSSAVGEMASELGAAIYLERVPLKYAGLRPWEIWLSEAQERMVLAVPPAHWPQVDAICRGLDIEATALGEFTGDGLLTLRYAGQVVGQVSVEFLHGGIPRRHLQAVWMRSSTELDADERGKTRIDAKKGPNPRSSALVRVPATAPKVLDDATDVLLALLAMPDTRSKEDVVRRYDHEVQGGTLVKPFVGAEATGPGDAAVLAPLDAAAKADPDAPRPGVALSTGINPAYGLLDPYDMAWAAVDEAMRNCVAVGADPDRVALLDNFCWGNPNLPDRLAGLVRCAEGCHDAAVAFGAPFVSGKDSLNNEYTGVDGRKHAIPGTLLISALGIVPDVRRTATSDLKQPGDLLYILGTTRAELGGSAYYRLNGIAGGTPPQSEPGALALYRALHKAIAAGTVRACHDLSEGGLAVSAAEMALGGGLGLELSLAQAPHAPECDRDDVLAFSESNARFLVEVAPEDQAAFEALFAGLPIARAGEVRAGDPVRLVGLDGRAFIQADLGRIERAWRGHLQ
jgi:phosphoribosylformylglycinamidine synthase